MAHDSIPQKVVVIMMDGFGEEYYRASNMPNLNAMEREGYFKIVPSLMPSVTNVNNAAICTGELPGKNGITGNSFYNPATGAEEFMEDSSLLLSPTIFERARRFQVRSAMFSSKKKSIGLLSKGTDLTVSPETASQQWIDRLGTPPPIYSKEVNYWLFNAALYTMRHDTSIGLYYIHTTDYPMHTWPPEATESKEHLHTVDSLIGSIRQQMPDAMILTTADHTVKHKSVCVDLEKACASRNMPIRIAISAERDKYIKHHRGFGGTSYVYLPLHANQRRIARQIRGIQGVEAVLTRKEAAQRYHLMPERIGDLVVLADDQTVFGNLETERESLPETYRTHGSTYEAQVPIFVYHARNAPAPDFFTSNYKLATWLYR